MISYIKKAFNEQEKIMKKYKKIVEQINNLETEFAALTDEQLQEKTTYFKSILENGGTIDDIKVEAFATVREASKRILGMRHFDVQLIGGLALLDGNIAEMATGEGKTLVASLPSYVRALEGKGVHVITVNEYLARRDYELNGQIHRFLGLTIGLNLSEIEPIQKQEAYKADITYGVGNEFGFDYLRDNMAHTASQKVQRPFHYAILDEIDSVLIDEAKTPLIIAGKSSVSSDLHYICAKAVKMLKNEDHYQYDPETKAVILTEDGISKIEKLFGIDNLYDIEHQVLYHYVIMALRAAITLKLDVDYIVKEGKIELVDQFTGRVMDGRSYSDGLHQAIEAKEGLEITDENKVQATITLQNFFRMYPILCGMTGTAKTEEKEFQQVYGMDVFPIPTNRPKIRVDMDDIVYPTIEAKYNAVAKEVTLRHKKGQPVLVGTTSIQQSEMLSSYLTKQNIPHQVLNAKSAEQEADLISLAGQKGKVTIATNMAGRGTDILLGEGVKELGGLHVIGTERHESRRIDNQLKGRAGRQGDPGSSQFIVSLEDELLARYASEDLEKQMKSIKTDENGIVTNKNIPEFFDRIQKIAEGINYSIREYTLKLDDVVNQQRNVIYKLRDKILIETKPLDLVSPIINTTIERLVDESCPAELIPEEWPLEELQNRLSMLLPSETVDLVTLDIEDLVDLKEYIAKKVENYITSLINLDNTEQLSQQARGIMLHSLDSAWIQHIDIMTKLKEGIGLRSYGQEDPMRAYEKEGYELFMETYQDIQETICYQMAFIFKQSSQEISE